MHKQQYEDYKYVMQDTYQIYLGSKYTFQEIVISEEVPFKFRLIVERYIYPKVSPDTTLESYFYYFTEEDFLLQIYKQMKLKVKFNILEEKKTIFGQQRREYTTKIAPIEKLMKITPQEKKKKGVVIQEIIVGKLALLAF